MDLQFLSTEFLGNNIRDYCWFFGAILTGLTFKNLISKYLSKLLFKIIGNNASVMEPKRFNDLVYKPLGLCIMLSIIYLKTIRTMNIQKKSNTIVNRIGDKKKY